MNHNYLLFLFTSIALFTFSKASSQTPTINISSPSFTSTTSGPVTYSITYSGADTVTLTNADITLNTTETATGTVAVTGSGTTFRTVTISNITGDGTIGISLAADTASNTSGDTTLAAGPSDTFIVDNIAPDGYTATIDQAFINLSNFNNVSFTLVNAEIGANYNYTVTSDSGGTTVVGSGVISSATETISNISLSGLADGIITLGVALTDTFGNSGIVIMDTKTKGTTLPSGYTVAIDMNQSPIDLSNQSAINFTFSVTNTNVVGNTYDYIFSSSNGGADVTGSGTVASAGSTEITDVDLSDLGDGIITLSFTITDDNNNTGNPVTDTEIKDAGVPIVSITSSESSPTTANSIPITVTFSEDVTGFAAGDITTTNGTISNFTAISGTEYTFNITHTSILSNSNITANIASAVAQDIAGNNNTAAIEFAIVAIAPALHNEIVDGDLSNIATTPTSLAFTSGTNRIIGSVTTSPPVDTRDYVTFTIPTGMQLSEILLQNYDDPATTTPNDGNRGFSSIDEGATTFEPGTGNANDYLGGAHLDPVTPGTDILSILASAPEAGAGFTAPLPAGTYTYVIQQTGPQVSEYTIDFILETETTPPTVMITSTESPGPTAANPIPITITFSEDVTGFDGSDLMLSNGNISGFSGSGGIYTATITPTSAGIVTANINSNAATDGAENGNIAATEFSIEFDNLLSIEDEILADGLSIYPSPSNNIVNINGATNLELNRAEIFDIQGKLILSKDLNANTGINTIDVSTIQSGIYIITIYSERASIARRLAIK